jgi:hypothetical protein
VRRRENISTRRILDLKKKNEEGKNLILKEIKK